jgi:cell division protein FtsB
MSAAAIATSAFRRPGARRVPLIIGSIAMLALLFLAVFPTRAYIAQRDAIAAEKDKAAVLQRENSRLSARVGQLQTDVEVERLAREQYNLVKPGEEAYAILPGAEGTAPAAATPAPSTPVPDKRPSFWSRIWHNVTFWK